MVLKYFYNWPQMKDCVMKNYLKRILTFLVLVLIQAIISGEDSGKEMITPENMAVWQKSLDYRSRGAMKFDKEKRHIHFMNTGSGKFYLADEGFSDFKIDCVVNFKKLNGRYSGFNLFLRDADGKRYWVYWRAKRRSLYVSKIRSNSKTIADYEKGKKKVLRPPKIKLNQDYILTVEMKGRQLCAYIDNKKYLEFVDPLPNMYSQGKIGVGAGTSDMTLKSIKISSLKKSEKLPVNSYKYINPPEKGDATGKILTDGKINSKKEQALWWLATKGDPVIVFDLGKEYFVNGLKIKAFASPNSNISAYRVLGSKNGQDWRILGGKVNQSDDSREQEQTLQCDFSGLARYVKLMLFRQKGDDTIKLGEVEIMGREARIEDKAAVNAPEKYYKGPMPAPVKMIGDEDSNWFYLEGGGLRFAISKTNGAIGPVFNKAKQQRCVIISLDSYYLETKKSANEFSEKNNIVVESKNKNGALTLKCRNKNLKDIDIVQIYRVKADGIAKTTQFINKGSQKDLFMTVKTGTVLDEEYRKEGWYFGADRGLGSRLKASQVVMDMTPTCHSPANTKVTALMNYKKDFGISQYRYAVNGKYCTWVGGTCEKSNHSPLYTPNGWKLGLITLHLLPEEPRSVEVRWNLFPEDEFFFWKQFVSIPEVNKLYNIKRPDWLLRLKTVVSDYSAFPLGRGANEQIIKRRVRRSVNLYDDGCIFMVPCAEDVWGDWYQGEPYSTGWCGEKIDNAYFRRLFDELRTEHPNLKIGVYTWAWTGWAYSKTFLNHPDWYISRNKNGYLRKAYQNGPMNYYRLLSAPGNMEYLLSAADKIIKQYDSDIFYIDGGGGGSNLIAWDKLTLDYPTDWQKFHWGLSNACRRIPGRERVFFTNSRSQGYVDIGYYEGINNRLSESTWRDSGDAMLALKMRNSLFPKMTFMPIYWRVKLFYSNYCIGLGLVPENIYASNELLRVPYVTAAYETRMFKFVPAGLKPDWRKNENTELEAYTMTHAPAAIFSIINHSKIPIEQEVSGNAERLGINVNKPIFSWLIKMEDIRNKKSGVSEPLAKRIYQNSNWGVGLITVPIFRGIVKAQNGRLSLKEKFDLNVLNMAIFSNCPAVVYSTNGRRKQIWQPNARGITVNGDIDLKDRVISLKTERNITADVKTAEILVYVPNEWRDIKITGAKLKQQVFVEKQKFILLALDKFGEISIKAEKSENFSINKEEQFKLNSVKVPNKLSLDLPEGDKFVTVYRNNIPVFFGNSNQLDLPKELESGKYCVNAIVGNTLYSGELDVASSWKEPYPGIRPPRTKAELKITDVNRTLKGIKVLKSAVNSSNRYNLPLFTKINPDNLEFAAGSTDYATSQYGYAMAGFEIEGAKILQLKLHNTFFRHWSNYERETRKAGNPRGFVGMIVDYHTPKGYSKRVALGMGLIQLQTKAVEPLYGKRGKPDAFVRLKDYIYLGKDAELSLDLSRWAPLEWDGRVWLSAAVNGGVFAGRKLFFTILGASDIPPENMPIDKGELLTGLLKQPVIVVPQISTPIKIDGRLTDESWEKAAETNAFRLAISLRKASQETEMYLCRDDKNLYIAVKCAETERQKLICDGTRLWGHDAIDIAFAPLPRTKKFHKFVINNQNKIYQETRPLQNRQEQWKISSSTGKNKNEWTFEAAIPLKYLKLKNGEIAFNLLRYRPDQSGMQAITWSPIPVRDYLDPKWFGSIKFQKFIQ